MEKTIAAIRKRIKKDYGEYMSSEGLEKLTGEAETFYHAIMTAWGMSCPQNEIKILINPKKINLDTLFDIADDWTAYITNNHGLEPKDAIMITPL